MTPGSQLHCRARLKYEKEKHKKKMKGDDGLRDDDSDVKPE
jgi:hypothetical protein